VSAQRRLFAAGLTALLLLCVGSPAALAAATVPVAPTSATNPLSPGIPASPVPPTTTAPPTIISTASTNSSGSSSISSNGVLIIAIGAVVVLAGISFFIWRDARRRAPVKAGGGDLGLDGRRAGSKAPPKSRKLSQAEKRRRKRGRAR
jgi:hypothetical protein